MYKVVVWNYRRSSITHSVSFRDALEILERYNVNGHIVFMNGIFGGLRLEKGRVTYFLNNLLN